MVALKHYKEHVLAAVEAGADVIIAGQDFQWNCLSWSMKSHIQGLLRLFLQREQQI